VVIAFPKEMSNDRLERRIDVLAKEVDELKVFMQLLQQHFLEQNPYKKAAVAQAASNYYDARAANMQALLERHKIRNASVQETLDRSQATLDRTASLRPPSTSGGEHARHVKGLHGKRC
jgi:hypothetical protein